MTSSFYIAHCFTPQPLLARREMTSLVPFVSLRFASRPTKFEVDSSFWADSLMRRLLLFLLLLTPSTLHAQTPAAARLALQQGNYAEAEELYEELIKQAKHAAL